MTKKKNNDELLKRFAPQTGRVSRDIAVYFLIVCEGEKTETAYFDAFPRRNTLRRDIVVDCEDSRKKTSAMQVVDKAIRLKNERKDKYDSVWAVFDKDENTDQSFCDAIKKAAKNGVKTAWSNEAFELWYILHFLPLEVSLPRKYYKEKIESAISEKLAKRGKFSYSKTAKNMYEIMITHGNQANAIKHAEKLAKKYKNNNYSSHNPCTMVYKLVEELNGTSKELNNSLSK
ncbi:RloB domain-containing protein [Dysgonomonas sp. 521]|uniref:RloB family protein n=1 Tax=Dysgonomonas sp. 521 TaxID=2302932 RepID=UPI0013D78AA5|nr:RloB family protein [Dysgonomonas sp. 521]NDV95740.1 RloB domain-containing protein [Dysgonomonas sp. 521]